jgi:hypothetical protein
MSNFRLIIVVRDPITGDSRELERQFDPTTSPATLSTKWNALGAVVLQIISDLQTAVAADPTAPPNL